LETHMHASHLLDCITPDYIRWSLLTKQCSPLSCSFLCQVQIP